MNKRLVELEDRRYQIVEKIAAQRVELAEIALRFKTPLSLLDRGAKAVRFVREHPAMAGGGVLAFVALRRHGLIGLVRKAGKILLNPTVLSYGSRLLSGITTRPSSETNQLLH